MMMMVLILPYILHMLCMYVLYIRMYLDYISSFMIKYIGDE